MNDNIPLAEDLLDGAESISRFIYGDVKFRRRVYHLAETKALPVFKMGATLCARKSTLTAWIEDQERNGGAGVAAYSSLAMTMDRYGHLFPSDDHKTAMNTIAEALGA